MNVHHLKGRIRFDLTAALDLVSTCEQINPRSRTLYGPVYWWAQIMKFFRPREAKGSVVSGHPDAGLLGKDLTVSIHADTSTRTVSNVLGAGHGANHPGRMKHTLPAHMAAEYWCLNQPFNWA
jgi:hypothetical protein